MSSIQSLLAVAQTSHLAGTLLSLAAALFFAAIYLFGGRANQVLNDAALRRFHSFASGCAISYVFVYIMPELHAIRVAHLQTRTDYIERLFPDYSVYLSALLGFLVFYGIESLMTRPRGRPGIDDGDRGSHTRWLSWLHITSFSIYTWLITFQIGRMQADNASLWVFALAMALHIAPIANRLRSEHAAEYEHRGAILLALASLAGWACGLTLNLPELLVLDMTAIVAGGVIVNAAIAELPKQRDASFLSFLTGAVAYSALLLTLSRFAQHGAHP